MQIAALDRSTWQCCNHRMSFITQSFDHLLQLTGNLAGGLSWREDRPVRGIIRIKISSRLSRFNGMIVSIYLIGDVLIDSGFTQARTMILGRLRDKKIRAVCLTHHHEDHSGTCGEIARERDCPVYLRNPDARFSEGLSNLKPYRLLWWGAPLPYRPEEMPELVGTGEQALSPIPIPGHSTTHTAFFNQATGVVFSGDLFISPGVTAVMSHENPYDSIRSLRRVAGLKPARLLSGHGLDIERPAELLELKADRIERAADKVVRLHAQGLLVKEIQRRVFTSGRSRDRYTDILSGGEFSRLNFVVACIKNHQDPAEGK